MGSGGVIGKSRHLNLQDIFVGSELGEAEERFVLSILW
jgi:hypothetical protein